MSAIVAIPLLEPKSTIALWLLCTHNGTPRVIRTPDSPNHTIPGSPGCPSLEQSEIEKVINSESHPTGSTLKENAQWIFSYLKRHNEDWNSDDIIERTLWWNGLFWLYDNAWWHYRSFVKLGFGSKGISERLPEGWGEKRKSPKKREYHYHAGLGTEGSPADIKDRLTVGGDNIPDQKVEEIGELGRFEYGFDLIRLVEKKGAYGEFLSLESGQTITGKDENDKPIQDFRTKKWFSLERNAALMNKLADLFEDAAKKINDGFAPTVKP